MTLIIINWNNNKIIIEKEKNENIKEKKDFELKQNFQNDISNQVNSSCWPDFL